MNTVRITLILLALLTVGCAHGQDVSTPLPAAVVELWVPVCRHNAVLAASVVGERYPVRIAYGIMTERKLQASAVRFTPPYSNPSMYANVTQNHVQAQAYIGGEWCWLGLADGRVVVTGKDRFNVTHYYTLAEFFAELMKDQRKERTP